jgi:hypothetical protein
MSLRAVCADASMPDRTTVYRWLEAHEDFRTKYALAAAAREDVIWDEIQDIADDASQDYKLVEKGGESVWVFDQEHLQRAKLRIDSRKWMLAKLSPKKYGDRIQQEHSSTPARLDLVILDPQSRCSAAASET